MKLPLNPRLMVGAVCCAIAGLVVMGVSWKEWMVQSYLDAKGVRAMGTIEGSERQNSKRNSKYNLNVGYALKGVKFRRSFAVKPEIALTHPVGSKIEVVFDPESPSMARLWLNLDIRESLMTLLMGAGLFCVSPILAFVSFRLRP